MKCFRILHRKQFWDLVIILVVRFSNSKIQCSCDGRKEAFLAWLFGVVLCGQEEA